MAEILTEGVPEGWQCGECAGPMVSASGYCGTGLCQLCATGGADADFCELEELEEPDDGEECV